MKLRPLLLIALAVPSVSSAQIFATVETEDHGAFVIELDHAFSPAAAANFIRLVEGSQPWVDEEGVVHTDEPFYNGLTFHSVTSSFEIVTGSRTGDGNDGPGYFFRDDFRSGNIAQSPPLTYSVYMENNGPNTNGSRWFVHIPTVFNPQARTGRYTRFGVVTPDFGGRINVANMSNTVGGAVEIKEITIFRRGLLAEAFNEFSPTWELPTLEPSTLSFRRDQGNYFLDWDSTPGSGVLLYSSPDLQNWLGPFVDANPPGSINFGLDLTDTIEATPQLFFRGITIDYDNWPSTEWPLNNASIEIFFDEPASPFTIRYDFDGAGAGGEWRHFQNGNRIGRGDIGEVEFEPVGPYAARLIVRAKDPGKLNTFRLLLHYDLDGVTFNTITPSRMSGDEIDESGEEPTLETRFEGRWRYTP